MSVERVSVQVQMDTPATVRVQVTGWRPGSTVAWLRVLHVQLDSGQPGLETMLRTGLSALLESVQAP